MAVSSRCLALWLGFAAAGVPNVWCSGSVQAPGGHLDGIALNTVWCRSNACSVPVLFLFAGASNFWRFEGRLI